MAQMRQNPLLPNKMPMLALKRLCMVTKSYLGQIQDSTNGGGGCSVTSVVLKGHSLPASRVWGHAPPENFENCTSNGAIWRHLGIKLPCNSRFKIPTFVLIQINFQERKANVYKLH